MARLYVGAGLRAKLSPKYSVGYKNNCRGDPPYPINTT
ncbi:hypothetical protein MC7420_8205 [Coleofasciculus chthonoplastes PCC 7420]|uniref:Uncharacterized protein n=1 Tax=Coleofasciculus chthonoplastes PCC 7420 TaxID=118168 RepID=B4W4D4_9CYAN|nr:hypothetical protein MC7420_8205 [Coleofasciculus chthonoplastes PCC 7420]